MTDIFVQIHIYVLYVFRTKFECRHVKSELLDSIVIKPYDHHP